MKFNRKLISKILLIIIVISAISLLTGCEVTPNDNINDALGTMSGGFLGSLILFMYSVLLAIGSAFAAVISFFAGLFQIIGELIGMLF